MEESEVCLMCAAAGLEGVLDCPPQPICHDFCRPQERARLYPLSLAICCECGLLQLQRRASLSEINSLRPPWQRFVEPESHLDDLVERLRILSPPRQGQGALGLSPTDESLLARLARHGYGPTGCGEGFLRGEALLWQQLCDRAPAQLIIARNLFEHCSQIAPFLRNVKRRLAHDGLLVLEVPEGERLLELRDYTLVWEEHTAYFTRFTMKRALQRWGFSLVDTITYPQGHQDCLITVWRVSVPQMNRLQPRELGRQLAAARGYGRAFQGLCRVWRSKLESLVRQRGRVALLGSGHLACTFTNLLGVADLLSFVADDDANKQGHYLPATDLPILPCWQLIEQRIAVCLLGVNPQNESQVLLRQRGFVEGGGEFFSIFPGSSRCFLSGREILEAERNPNT